MINTENPFMTRLAQIQDAELKLAYTTWLISFLRSEPSLVVKIPGNDELLAQHRNQH